MPHARAWRKSNAAAHKRLGMRTMKRHLTQCLPAGDEPDSSNSCPLVDSQLPPDYYVWYSGLRPWDYYYGDWFNLNGYYAYRYPATIVRAGFGKIGSGRAGGTGHS